MGVGRETTAALASPPRIGASNLITAATPRVTITRRAPCRDTEDVLGSRVALPRTPP